MIALVLIKSIIFVLLLSVISIMLGRIVSRHLKKENDSLVLAYICGILIMLALFYPIVIAFYYAGGTLTGVVIIWITITAALVVYEIVKDGKTLVEICVSKIKHIISINNYKRESSWVLIVAVAIIAFQIAYVCIAWHSDADDATYVGMATTSYFTDTINQFFPTNGLNYEDITNALDYILAPFPIFFATWGKLLSLHPAIIMHSLMPINFIALSYSVYYLLGKKIFKSQDKATWFLLFVALINLFGNWSIRSTSTFLLFRIWQGKAVLCSTIIPLMVYIFIRLIDKSSKWGDWILLLFTATSACLISGMGPILCIPLICIYMLIDIIFIRKPIRLLWYMICMLPCIIVALVYVNN